MIDLRTNKLNIAAYAGICSLVLIPPEIFLEHMLAENPSAQWIFPLMILIYAATVLCSILFYNGFYRIAGKLRARAIQISVVTIILLHFVWYTFQVFALRNEISFYNVFGATVLIVFGIARIIFGCGVFKVRDALGRSAKAIAYLEMLTGLVLVSVVIYYVGLFISLVVTVMQIILLFRLHKSGFLKRETIQSNGAH